MQSITYFSLFAGIGGFELGIEEAFRHHRAYRRSPSNQDDLLQSRHISMSDPDGARATCVGFCEIEPSVSTIYRRHFRDHPAMGDIRKLDAEAMPDFDLLCGGFPCQSFSVAGHRQGLEDKRGALFLDIVRIAQTKRPPFLLLENVKGFLSLAQGNAARYCFALLDELGYDLQWQVLNGKDFGVPQNRERVFIVGHHRKGDRRQVFPFSRAVETALEPDYPLVDGEHLVRRLTPTECERVMGFPDGWTEGVCDTHRYHALANAVVPAVVREICWRMFG